MKINIRHIKRFLEKDFRKFRAAVLVGNNNKLISESTDIICQNFLANEEDQFNKVRLANLDTNFHAITNEIRMAPLFGNNKVVIINEAHHTLLSAVKGLLLTEDISANIFIVISCARLSGEPIKTFFETSHKVALVPCYLDDSAYAQHKETFAELECDTYVTLMFEKKFDQAEFVLAKLIATGIRSNQVIRCALRYYMQLYVAQSLINKGVPMQQVSSHLKPQIFFKYIPAFNLALKEYSVKRILSAMEQLVSLECGSKVADVQDAWTMCDKKLYEILSGCI